VTTCRRCGAYPQENGHHAGCLVAESCPFGIGDRVKVLWTRRPDSGQHGTVNDVYIKENLIYVSVAFEDGLVRTFLPGQLEHLSGLDLILEML
jgi:hypothetical protein